MLKWRHIGIICALSLPIMFLGGGPPQFHIKEEDVAAIAVHVHYSTCEVPVTIIMANATYTLQKSPKDYEGIAQLIVLLPRDKPDTMQYPIRAPKEKVRQFLDWLGRSVAKEGTAKPVLRRPKETWYTEIVVACDSTNYTFCTQSQVDGLVPWVLSTQGRKFVVQSKEPSIALNTIESCFEKWRWQNMLMKQRGPLS